MGEPAIIVHSPDHITAALSAARETDCEVLVLSARDAATSLGAGVFRAMVDLAQEATPERTFVAALDCGDNAGHALAAIREGITAIVLSDACPAHDRVADIARRNDVKLLSSDIYEARGGAAPLDLLERSDPLAACREFLHTVKTATDQAHRTPS